MIHCSLRLDEKSLMWKKTEKIIESAYVAVNSGFEACLNAQGTTTNQWRVIETLNDYPGLTLKELSRQTKIKIPALSKLVDRMVRDALVHRKQSSVDRRSIQLYISDHGKETLQRCLPDVDAFRSTLAEILDPHTNLVLQRVAGMDGESVSITATSEKRFH